MTNREFIELVAEMRDAQRCKSASAKHLENDVDRVLIVLLSPLRQGVLIEPDPGESPPKRSRDKLPEMILQKQEEDMRRVRDSMKGGTE